MSEADTFQRVTMLNRGADKCFVLVALVRSDRHLRIASLRVPLTVIHDEAGCATLPELCAKGIADALLIAKDDPRSADSGFIACSLGFLIQQPPRLVEPIF